MGWLESNGSARLGPAQAKCIPRREELEAAASLAAERFLERKRMEENARKARDCHLYLHPAYGELFALCQDEGWVCWLLRSDDGNPPLIKASRGRENECVRILLKHCQPDAQDEKGMTALMFAALTDCLPLIRLLLPKSNPLVLCGSKKTALDYATGPEAHALIADRIDSIFLKVDLSWNLPLGLDNGREHGRI